MPETLFWCGRRPGAAPPAPRRSATSPSSGAYGSEGQRGPVGGAGLPLTQPVAAAASLGLLESLASASALRKASPVLPRPPLILPAGTARMPGCGPCSASCPAGTTWQHTWSSCRRASALLLAAWVCPAACNPPLPIGCASPQLAACLLTALGRSLGLDRLFCPCPDRC